MSTSAPTSAQGGADKTDRLIRFADARKTLGLSRSTMYRMLERGELPHPIKIGALTLFSERELQTWIAGKLASRGTEVRDA